MVNGILDLEKCAHILADPLTLGHANGLLATAALLLGADCVRDSSVDDHPQHPPDRLSPKLHVEQIEPVPAGHPVGNCSNLIESIPVWCARDHAAKSSKEAPEKAKSGHIPTQDLLPLIVRPYYITSR